MTSAAESVPVEVEIGRIRELSKGGRHREALAAAEALAVAEPHNPITGTPSTWSPPASVA